MTHIKRVLKILSAVIAATFLLSALFSCGNKETDVPSGMKRIDNEFVDYNLFIPEDWISDISTGIVTARTSDNSNISVQIMTVSGEYKSLDDYVKTGYLPILTSTYLSFSLDEEYTEGQTLGGKAACKYVYTVSSDGVDYKVMQIFAVEGLQLYIMTYTSRSDLFESHLDEISDITENFSFR